MAAFLLEAPYSQFFDNNGDPLSGGLVYTYIAGTTTPLATFTDASGLTPAANPIVLDSAGRTAIWASGVYRIDVKTSADVLVRTTDNITVTNAGGDMSKAVYDPANIAQQLVGLTAVQTLTNKTITTTASSTSAAGFNLPHGSAPSSPFNGDMWTTTAGLFVRINGSTVSFGSGGGSISTVAIQVFTSSGTYTPTSGMKYCIVELVGGGGGGRGGTNGTNGGNSSFGALASANGGTGGQNSAGGLGGNAATGDVNITGQNGTKANAGFVAASSGGSSLQVFNETGNGGSSILGLGGNAGAALSNGTGYGAGGSTAIAPATNDIGGGGGGYSRRLLTAAQVGVSQIVTIGAAGTAGSTAGAGTAGICIVTEFV